MGEDRAWVCSVDELAKHTQGQVLSLPGTRFVRVGTDSRADLSQRLFIPLKGENFDAHAFVAQAVAQGAAAIMVHEWRDEWEPLKARVAFVRVDNTLTGLQMFARAWRKLHKYFVLGITGSNGKTSSKEFTFTLLREHLSVHASKGSYNNHWGLPLSILEAGPEHTHLILEMGMSQSGELWKLSQIAEPNAVVVTTVGRAHIGELGSQTAVAAAKEEIYNASPQALHVFNMDNEWTMRMQARSQAQQIRFSSFRTDVDVHLRAQRMNWDGLDLIGHIRKMKNQSWVHVLGRHNANNLMVAASMGLACGLEPEQIWSGFSLIRDSAWGRNQMVPLKNGARVLFDAYNANPDSMQALLKNLYEMDLAGRKFLIVGDMKQLGSFSAQAHEEVGERAGSIGFAGVWFVGEHADSFMRGLQKVSRPAHMFTSPDIDQNIAREFFALLNEGDLVALKASRGVGLEHVMDNWPLTAPLGKKP